MDELLKSDIVIKAFLAILGTMTVWLWNSKPSKAELEERITAIRKEFEEKITAAVQAVVSADVIHDSLQIDSVKQSISGLKDLINLSNTTLREDIRDLRSEIKNGH